MKDNHRDRKSCAACQGTGYALKEPVSTLCDNCHSKEKGKATREGGFSCVRSKRQDLMRVKLSGGFF